jgi:hypothetical protein
MAASFWIVSDEFIRDKDQALAWRAEQVGNLMKYNDYLEVELRSVVAEAQRHREKLEEIHASRGWKFLVRLRAVRDKLTGNGIIPIVVPPLCPQDGL